MVTGRSLIFIILTLLQLEASLMCVATEFEDPSRAKLWQGLRAAALGTGHWHATPKHMTSLLNSVPPGSAEYKYILKIIRELEALPRKSQAAHSYSLNHDYDSARQKPQSSIRPSVDSGPIDWSQNHQPSLKLRKKRVQASHEAAWGMTADQASSAAVQAMRRNERVARRRWERGQQRQQYQINVTSVSPSESQEGITKPFKYFNEINSNNSSNSSVMIGEANIDRDEMAAETKEASTPEQPNEGYIRQRSYRESHLRAALGTVNQHHSRLGLRAVDRTLTEFSLNELHHKRVASGVPCSGFDAATQRLRYRSARDAVLADIKQDRAKMNK
jgi:hypothetical protein